MSGELLGLLFFGLSLVLAFVLANRLQLIADLRNERRDLIRQKKQLIARCHTYEVEKKL